MKTTTILPAVTLLIAASLFGFQDVATTAESADEGRAGVERAIKDYVEGFYEAKPELIEKGVSKDLKKMGYWKGDGDEEYSDALHMTFEQALKLAANWNKGGKQGTDLKYEIEIYDVADKTACGKLTADWGIDYLQLVREGKAWKIHHVLWQSHPPKPAVDKK